MSDFEKVLADHAEEINRSNAKSKLSFGTKSSPTPKRKRNLQWSAVGAVVFGAWAYTGFMGPITLLNGMFAKEECVRLANENKSRFFNEGQTIKAVDSWIKNGKWVVALGVFTEGKSAFTSRTCVVDGSHVRIVSLIEQGFWQ